MADSRHRLANLARLSVGLFAGLCLVEGAFHLRAGGGYPHLNVFEPDPAHGVRLRPGARTRLQIGQDPPVPVAVNELGYRGGPWPAPGQGEILVVGDGRAFGVGVSGADTAASVLAQRTGRTVLNAAVPTYGPADYLAVSERVLDTRGGGVDTVVEIVNLSNDLFEFGRPGAERFAARDGWAVRVETAGPGASRVPGRRWFMERSHAVLALRGWWHGRPGVGLVGLPSEGICADVAAWMGVAEAGGGGDADAFRLTRAAVAAAAAQARVGDDVVMREGVVPARHAPAMAALLAEAAVRFGGGPSPLSGHLGEMQALSARHGARLVVVAIPLDVQASATEWAKYGAEAIDLAGTHALTADLMTAARGVGAVGVDPTAALAAAPGAFLAQDPHLSALGHRLVAEAIGDVLSRSAE